MLVVLRSFSKTTNTRVKVHKTHNGIQYKETSAALYLGNFWGAKPRSGCTKPTSGLGKKLFFGSEIPNSTLHTTFFQILNTPPKFNMEPQNEVLEDVFFC